MPDGLTLGCAMHLVSTWIVLLPLYHMRNNVQFYLYVCSTQQIAQFLKCMLMKSKLCIVASTNNYGKRFETLPIYD